MEIRNDSNLIQTPHTYISSIFPQSFPFILPFPNIFYYHYQSVLFRHFIHPRLAPSINLFVPPLIKIKTTPENEKKHNLSIDSIIGSSFDENPPNNEIKG